MKPTRHTSPKGTNLTRGENTRQAIINNLPATARKITDITGRNFSTITMAINLMAKEGIIVEADHRAPVEGGGTPQKVWCLPYVRRAVESDPWFNAWYARSTGSSSSRVSA